MPKSFRLGGEFEREAVPRDSVDNARRRFMKTCVHHDVEPRVLTSLLEDATWAETLAGGDPPDPRSCDRALRKWGKTWHLSDPWRLKWAHTQLKLRWGKKRGLWPPTDRAQAFAAALALGDFKPVSGPPLKPEALRFETKGWEIEREDRRSFRTNTVGASRSPNFKKSKSVCVFL